MGYLKTIPKEAGLFVGFTTFSSSPFDVSCALVAGHIRLLQVPEALSKEASQGKSLTRLVTRVTRVTRGIGFPNSLLSLLGVARWIRWGMTLPGVIPKISAPQVLSKYPVLCEYLEPWPEKKHKLDTQK